MDGAGDARRENATEVVDDAGAPVSPIAQPPSGCTVVSGPRLILEQPRELRRQQPPDGIGDDAPARTFRKPRERLNLRVEDGQILQFVPTDTSDAVAVLGQSNRRRVSMLPAAPSSAMTA